MKPKIYPFKYVPDVTVPSFGATERDVAAEWRKLLGFRQHSTTGQHKQCTDRVRAFVKVQHRDESGNVSHTTVHGNLLADEWWGDGWHAKHADSIVYPGRIDAELPA